MAKQIDKSMLIHEIIEVDPGMPLSLWQPACTVSDVLPQLWKALKKHAWFMA